MVQTLSEKIRACRHGVVKNPYQGKDRKVVFVCSMGILRSATAARLYAHRYNTRTAGTWEDALIPLTPVLIAWADQLVFVTRKNYEQVIQRINDLDIVEEVVNKSKILEIPDDYEHMHPELIKAFIQQYEPI